MVESVRVAVLGGAGFIGSAVVRELNSRGVRPLVFDLLTYAGRLENLRGADYEFVRGDIRGAELHEALSGFRPEVIINLAAETHVDRSIYAPQDFVTTNVVARLTSSRPPGGLGPGCSTSPLTRSSATPLSTAALTSPPRSGPHPLTAPLRRQPSTSFSPTSGRIRWRPSSPGPPTTTGPGSTPRSSYLRR
ncbi:MAG: dTDP-D-glucose 4,6-dehydratase [uncultured Acidilobus sp. OSP8]|nr:MAG: dTDP-D-glucose 4,6-dehydratase [uncultured Acidilobus sp. OSP8]